MSDWLNGLCELNGRGERAVLATVLSTRGSVPREQGARMTIGENETWDTIGGGQLEHAVIESARFLLEDVNGEYVNTVERHVLGPSLGQCCGGTVSMLLERIPRRRQDWLDALVDAGRGNEPAFLVTLIGGTDKHVLRHPADASGTSLPSDVLALAARAMETGKAYYDRGTGWFIDPVAPVDFNIVLFGAGHVGSAVATVVATLPCNLTWVESRNDRFPDHAAPNIRFEATRTPESLVGDCLPGSFYLVMTHSHPLDLSICERVLKREDFAYCGLIGSMSKRNHFEKRLRLKGVTETSLNRLTCPIGIEGISGKRPAEIAVAVTAELLKVREEIHAGIETGPERIVHRLRRKRKL